jgi:hypothetical protein
MLTRHPSRLLAQYCDGQLLPDQKRNVEAHLITCERCRRERDDILFAASLLRQMTVASPPASVWHDLDRRLRETPPSTGWRWRWQLALAALLLAIGAGAIYQRTAPLAVRPWEVALRESGRSEQSSLKAEGEWVETTSSSRARIVVGPIGTVEVEPRTRVRLGALRPDAYRLELTRGTISARISAPPRLFIVDTPASTLVDLGCAYRVTVDLDGRGDLQVTEGWTSLEWRGRTALVPAGASARIRPGEGPGMPTFDDASASLKAAVTAFDSGDDRQVALLLSHARVRDTLTLWHLMSRVSPSERARVYDRIAELVPPPPSAPRDLVMQLDTAALNRWREELAWHW